MPNKKITGLPAVVTATIDRVTKLFAFVQAGVTSKASIEQMTGEYIASGTLTALELSTIGSVNVNAVPAPGAGYYLRIIRADVFIQYGTSAYIGYALSLKNTGATRVAFAFQKILESTASRGEMGVLQDFGVSTTDTMLLENTGLDFTTFTGADPGAGGDSTIKYKIRYAIEPIL